MNNTNVFSKSHQPSICLLEEKSSSCPPNPATKNNRPSVKVELEDLMLVLRISI